MTPRAAPPSPAAGAPLLEVGALVAEDRVVAVAGVEPGLVGEAVEDLGADVVEQRGEGVLVAEGVADATREQAVAGPQVRGAAGVVVQQRDGAWGVADEVDHLEY